MRTKTTAAGELNPTARHFLRRLTIATGGGMFIDGFVFASFAAALAGKAMSNDLGIGSIWEGLISASTLIGTFFGGIFLGYVTDKVGRRPMFTIDLSVFLACALAMLLVSSVWMLFFIGIVMGLAVGADYSIGSPLLSEFTPNAKRGNYLGVLEILWNVGYVTAYLIGYIINTNWPGGWHIILAASVLPAIFCLAIRHGLPESPRWLMSKGRREEAEQIIRDQMHMDPRSGDFASEPEEETEYRVLFSPDYLKRTIFACTFWVCIVLPYFALTFFQASVLEAIGIGGSALAGALAGTCIALVGAATGWYLVDRVGRRMILITPMFVCSAFLFAVSFKADLPIWLTVTCFFGYLFSYGIMSILPGIYPMEVFPTSVRTSGVGVATAASRVGAAIGTFLLPISQDHLGLSWTMIFMAIVCAVGGLTSYSWAPETNGKALSETANRIDPHKYRSRSPRAA
ncbi:MAG TPA: MFS transporter [Mycobacteriales bacterium]|nr:MFS transporter [Mycobacteriales bacterium]